MIDEITTNVQTFTNTQTSQTPANYAKSICYPSVYLLVQENVISIPINPHLIR